MSILVLSDLALTAETECEETQDILGVIVVRGGFIVLYCHFPLKGATYEPLSGKLFFFELKLSRECEEITVDCVMCHVEDKSIEVSMLNS